MIIIVLVRHRVEALGPRVDGFAPDIESPIDECAIELVLIRVLDDDSPVADSRFTPVTPSVYAGFECKLLKWTYQ